MPLDLCAPNIKKGRASLTATAPSSTSAEPPAHWTLYVLQVTGLCTFHTLDIHVRQPRSIGVLHAPNKHPQQARTSVAILHIVQRPSSSRHALQSPAYLTRLNAHLPATLVSDTRPRFPVNHAGACRCVLARPQLTQLATHAPYPHLQPALDAGTTRTLLYGWTPLVNSSG